MCTHVHRHTCVRVHTHVVTSQFVVFNLFQKHYQVHTVVSWYILSQYRCDHRYTPQLWSQNSLCFCLNDQRDFKNRKCALSLTCETSGDTRNLLWKTNSTNRPVLRCVSITLGVFSSPGCFFFPVLTLTIYAKTQLMYIRILIPQQCWVLDCDCSDLLVLINSL